MTRLSAVSMIKSRNKIITSWDWFKAGSSLWFLWFLWLLWLNYLDFSMESITTMSTMEFSRVCWWSLCTSITESKHIDVVKKSWRKSNQCEALGKMLVTNQSHSTARKKKQCGCVHIALCVVVHVHSYAFRICSLLNEQSIYHIQHCYQSNQHTHFIDSMYVCFWQLSWLWHPTQFYAPLVVSICSPVHPVHSLAEPGPSPDLSDPCPCLCVHSAASAMLM